MRHLPYVTESHSFFFLLLSRRSEVPSSSIWKLIRGLCVHRVISPAGGVWNLSDHPWRANVLQQEYRACLIKSPTEVTFLPVVINCAIKPVWSCHRKVIQRSLERQETRNKMHGKRAAAEQTGRLMLDYCKMAFEVPCMKEPEAGGHQQGTHKRLFWMGSFMGDF